jgi:predicted ferric reductase
MKNFNVVLVIGVFVGFPLFLWAVGNFPARTWLKEGVSLLTLFAFFMMTGQFFFSRTSRKELNLPGMKTINRLHKVFGYVFIGVLLLHPFMILLPRFFEAGIKPLDALATLLTTYDSTGVLLGISAWLLMLVIGITSFFREKLPMSYANWRLLHGILSILFIVVASWHAIDLGRHTNTAMIFFIIAVSGMGILLLLRTYLVQQQKNIS